MTWHPLPVAAVQDVPVLTEACTQVADVASVGLSVPPPVLLMSKVAVFALLPAGTTTDKVVEPSCKTGWDVCANADAITSDMTAGVNLSFIFSKPGYECLSLIAKQSQASGMPAQLHCNQHGFGATCCFPSHG